jgi:hypothetical protein
MSSDLPEHVLAIGPHQFKRLFVISCGQKWCHCSAEMPILAAQDA